MLVRGQMTEFHMYEYLPFLPIVSYSTGFGLLIVCLSRKPHPSQMRLARLITWKNRRLLEGRLRRDLLHCSQPSHIFQHVTCVLGGLCMGLHQAMALIGDAKQATNEGQSG